MSYWANLTEDQKKNLKEKRDIKRWAAQIKPGWVPDEEILSREGLKIGKGDYV